MIKRVRRLRNVLGLLVFAVTAAACGIGVTGSLEPSSNPLLEAGVVDVTEPRDADVVDVGAGDAFVEAEAGPIVYASCADARAAGQLVDGEVTLHLPTSPEKTFKAWCADMADAGEPTTYLTLFGPNTSSYDATRIGSSTVVTTWQRLRFDPTTLVVDTADFRFSTSVGSVNHANDTPGFATVTRVPYGVARDCATPNSALGQAKISLTGIPFELDVGKTQWMLGGNESNGTVSGTPQAATITGGGFCGWNAPSALQLGGKLLYLRYRP